MLQLFHGTLNTVTIPLRTTPSTQAWGALLRAQARVAKRLDGELRAETELTLAWYEILLVLSQSDAGRMRMTDLADSLLLSKSAATRLVDRLVARGLVERSTCSSDRRGTEVELTRKGKEAFLTAGRIHLRGIEAHFGTHTTDEEKAVIANAMSRVADENAPPH